MTAQAILKRTQTLVANYQPLPDKRWGKAKIETNKVSGKLPVVGFRDGFYTGMPLCTLQVEDYLEQKLVHDDHDTWMTNQPCEIFQMWHQFARHAQGRVLIGGLGLGIIANMCVQKHNVRSVTVVEYDDDVVRLVSPHLNPKVKVERFDIHDYCRDLGHDEYNWCFLDTWQSTGEWAWQTEVVPLRRMIRDKIPQKNVRCWQEATMQGQVLQGLPKAAGIDPDRIRKPVNCHWYAFRKALSNWGGIIKGVEKVDPKRSMSDQMDAILKNERNKELRAAALIFIQTVGTDYWEATFGAAWDEAWRAKE